MRKFFLVISIISLFIALGKLPDLISYYASTSNLPSAMFVVSPGGTGQRHLPSATSREVGWLKYGDMVHPSKKENLEEINGTTSYWYRDFSTSGYSWVFGGDLSSEPPPGIQTLLGDWYDEHNKNYYYRFFSDYSYSEGDRKKDTYRGGNWSREDNELTLKGKGAGAEAAIIILTEIDRNQMLLEYPGGRQVKLFRQVKRAR